MEEYTYHTYFQYLDSGVVSFTVMFRRDPVLPIYLDTGSQEKDEATTQENIKELTERVMSEKKGAEKKMAINIATSQVDRRKTMIRDIQVNQVK